MNKNIIKNANAREVRKSINRETLFFPVSLNKKNALLNEVKFIKIVVLPSSFNPKSIYTDNIPININSSLTVVSNDNIIDSNEVGNSSSTPFTRNILSKNIVSNLSQDNFSNFEIFIDKNDTSLQQEFIVNIPRSKIDLSLKAQRSMQLSAMMQTSEEDYELPHYFIIYVLDADENVLQNIIVNPDITDKKIDDYADADTKLVEESFIDEIGGNIDIDWESFRFNALTNEIISGPSIRLNYYKFLDFINNVNVLVKTVNITLEYANENYRESFFTPITLMATDFAPISNMNIQRSVNIMKLSFLNKFAKIEFDNDKDRAGTVDVSDYFENKFIVNLYNSFEKLNIEEQTVEITVTLENHSYTKDIIIEKENFYNFYAKYLEYNKEEIVRKTINSQISIDSTINDLGLSIGKLSITKFDYKSYSLNVLNDFSYFDFNTNNKTDIEELFFDDNCTFDNSLKQISKNRFYIKSLFSSRDVSDFYFKNDSAGSDVVDISLDRFNIYRRLLGQNIRNNNDSNRFSDVSSGLDDLTMSRRVDTLNKPNVRGVFGDIRKPLNIGIRESLLQNSTVLVQRNLSLSTNASLSRGTVEFSVNQKNLNTDLISSRLGITLNSSDTTSEARQLSLNNNMISTFTMFSEDDKFLGTVFKKNTDINSLEGGSKQINLLEDGSSYGGKIDKVEFKSFILSKDIIDSLGTSATDAVKEELCRILVDAKPSKYHYIVRKINNEWFKESIDINSVVNEIGELLSSSNLENIISIFDKNPKNPVLKKKPFVNRTKLKRIGDVVSKKLNIDKISKVKSSRVINHMFNFGFNNIKPEAIKTNLVFDLKESFIIKKESRNKDYIYEISLNNNSKISNDVKSDNFSSLNIYCFYGFEYYNKNITNKKENIAALNVTPNGCLIDRKFVEIVTRFKYKIDRNKLLISSEENKILNYNEDYYNIVKTVWENSKSLNVKSLINRILIEVILDNGEKTYYGHNELIQYNSKFNKFKSVNRKTNLSINIDNNKLRNPNMILSFGK